MASCADADLVIARATVNEALTRGGKDTSVPWENPRTGARGTVTPLAPAYTQDGSTCHDFLASYVRPGSKSWLQGEACREEGHGKSAKCAPGTAPDVPQRHQGGPWDRFDTAGAIALRFRARHPHCRDAS